MDCCIDLSPIQQHHQNQKQQKIRKQNLEVNDQSTTTTTTTTTSAASTDNSRFIERLRACVLLDASSSSSSSSSTKIQTTQQQTNQTNQQCARTEPTAWMRNNGEYLVHPKLSHFFLMLWYACKIEHVVRNYARCWLDEEIRSRYELFPHSQTFTVKHSQTSQTITHCIIRVSGSTLC